MWLCKIGPLHLNPQSIPLLRLRLHDYEARVRIVMLFKLLYSFLLLVHEATRTGLVLGEHTLPFTSWLIFTQNDGRYWLRGSIKPLNRSRFQSMISMALGNPGQVLGADNFWVLVAWVCDGGALISFPLNVQYYCFYIGLCDFYADENGQQPTAHINQQQELFRRW